ncbi:MAG: S10 family serine carboxypeptidase-like protein [Caulobacteraceae bacterium]
MKTPLLLATLCLAAGSAPAQETTTGKTPLIESQKPAAGATSSPDRGVIFAPEAVSSRGQVTVEGQRVDYRAVAGTIVVHPKGWDDAASAEQRDPEARAALKDTEDSKKNPKAEASMFYVAYFKAGVPSSRRPITFLYNGGPGSSTVWLHMGAFGPKRVVTADDSHTPAAPYRLVGNAYSLLDASDLVFIDAPGTGFSRIAGADKEKAFYGVDPDAYAFGEFIMGFLSKYGRWNSPKYLFGESYGTPRSAVLVNALETGHDIDFNGVILLSQILDFDLSVDGRSTIRARTRPISPPCPPTRRAPGTTTACKAAGRPTSKPSCARSSSSPPPTTPWPCRPARSWARRAARPSPSGWPPTPACRSPTSSRRTCGSTAASSRKTCRTPRA